MLRQTISRILPPIGFALTLLCTPHCNADRATEEATDLVEATDGVVLSAATWKLGLDTKGIDFDANGGWSVTTNLGYRVHIDTGHVVLHRVALIPCPTETAFLDLSIASAFAHEEESDPSSMETIAVTDLLQPQTKELGANSFAPNRYCQMYWLVARGMDGKTSADGLDMSNRSVFLEGTWERGSESGTLLVDTWWPSGVIMELKDVVEPDVFDAAASETSVHFAWIDIDLAMAHMFDEIEFAADSEAMVTDTILDNLILGANLTIDLQSP